MMEMEIPWLGVWPTASGRRRSSSSRGEQNVALNANLDLSITGLTNGLRRAQLCGQAETQSPALRKPLAKRL